MPHDPVAFVDFIGWIHDSVKCLPVVKIDPSLHITPLVPVVLELLQAHGRMSGGLRLL